MKEVWTEFRTRADRATHPLRLSFAKTLFRNNLVIIILESYIFDAWGGSAILSRWYLQILLLAKPNPMQISREVASIKRSQDKVILDKPVHTRYGMSRSSKFCKGFIIITIGMERWWWWSVRRAGEQPSLSQGSGKICKPSLSPSPSPSPLFYFKEDARSTNHRSHHQRHSQK